MDFCFPSFIWRKDEDRPVVHLTFDDGPSESTPELLSILERGGQKATFFLLGKQVEKYPGIIDTIKEAGHSVGIHGFDHLNAWKTPRAEFMTDFDHALEMIPAALYRPPYGRFRTWMKRMMPVGMELVMWSRSPGDYVARRTSEEIADRAVESIQPGEIIVLHDNDRHHPKSLQALEMIMSELKAKGLHSEAL